MRDIYFDHAATTALSEKALEEMLPYFRREFGNPSAIYGKGQTAKNVLEKCRERAAKALGAFKTEIVFTSGGTESDNLVVRSVLRSRKHLGKHVISSAIEHNAIRHTLEQMEEDGFEVTYLIPDRRGQITPEQLEAAIRPDTIFISIMLANNVVGTILDIPALAKAARKHHIPFHTDATQAVGHIPLNVHQLGVDYLSLSAHKFNGPKGVGILYLRIPNRLTPIQTGGGQEKEMRSGTENIPGIVGMTAALEEAVAGLPETVPHLRELQQHVIGGACKIPGVHLTGEPENRLPGFCSFVVEGLTHSVYLVNDLNEQGFCVSSGSACSAASKEASHVLLAMGYENSLSRASLRVTLGPENTREEVEEFLRVLPEAVARVRAEERKKNSSFEGQVRTTVEQNRPMDDTF